MDVDSDSEKNDSATTASNNANKKPITKANVSKNKTFADMTNDELKIEIESGNLLLTKKERVVSDVWDQFLAIFDPKGKQIIKNRVQCTVCKCVIKNARSNKFANPNQVQIMQIILILFNHHYINI